MCSPLPILEMVLISYLVINIIYRRYCRNGFKRKLCLFYSCLTAYLAIIGVDSSQWVKYTIGKALESGLGKTE